MNKSKRYLLFFYLITAIGIGTINAQVKSIVVDELDNSPIIAASVFDASGNILGLTDENGNLPVHTPNHYPLTIRCMSYEPQIVASPTDSIGMIACSYDLDEVVVIEGERNVLKLTCYVREYLSMTTKNDTTISFNEHMVDVFIPRHKKAKFKGRYTPRVLKSRHYTLDKFNGKDSVSTSNNEPIWINLVKIDSTTIYEPKSFKSSNNIVKSDSVRGKYYLSTISRKTPSTYFVSEDKLADVKEHKLSPWILKVLGLSIDFTKFYATKTYLPSNNGAYKAEDLICTSMAMDAIARGKFFKKSAKSDENLDVKMLFELYIADREFISADEAKAQCKERPNNVTFTIPKSAPKLDAKILSLIKRCNDKQNK